MNTTSLILLAGGASSRMKTSVANHPLDPKTRAIAQQQHKCLIPLGKEQKPLLIRLLENGQAAGYTVFYIVTAPENQAFHDVLEAFPMGPSSAIDIRWVIQHTPSHRKKPLGTADAVRQVLRQYPQLQNERFTVGNGDNLYSVESLKKLRLHQETPHAMIGYARSALLFSKERIRKFAILEKNAQGFLTQIIEKPTPEQMENATSQGNDIYVSMNLFLFHGGLILPYLENCPLHPERDEMELPVAVLSMIDAVPNCLFCYALAENVPDITAATDLSTFA